jgi:hypothetical protein
MKHQFGKPYPIGFRRCANRMFQRVAAVSFGCVRVFQSTPCVAGHTWQNVKYWTDQSEPGRLATPRANKWVKRRGASGEIWNQRFTSPPGYAGRSTANRESFAGDGKWCVVPFDSVKS